MVISARGLFVLAMLGSAACGALVACSDSKNGGFPGGGDDAGQADAGGRADATATQDAGGTTGDDAGGGGNALCALTAEYEIECGRSGDLTCGDAGFAAWCASEDMIVNSETFRTAELACLTSANCDPEKRHDCDYRTYNAATPTTAETMLVDSYCQTCEPADIANCAKRNTTYDPDAGPQSVSDLFVAAWELSDPLVDQVRTMCTGGALDAGTSDGGCAKAFSNCAGGVYIDSLPDCPK